MRHGSGPIGEGERRARPKRKHKAAQVPETRGSPEQRIRRGSPIQTGNGCFCAALRKSLVQVEFLRSLFTLMA